MAADYIRQAARVIIVPVGGCGDHNLVVTVECIQISVRNRASIRIAEAINHHPATASEMAEDALPDAPTKDGYFKLFGRGGLRYRGRVTPRRRHRASRPPDALRRADGAKAAAGSAGRLAYPSGCAGPVQRPGLPSCGSR